MRNPQPTKEQEQRWEQLSALAPRALAWLALGPAWPSEVAEGGFPLEPANSLTGPPVTEKLQSEAERGFLTALPATTPWEGAIFSLPASTRRSAQELFALDPRYGREYLQRELALSGQAMQRSGGSLLEFDPILSRWARLAALARNEAELAEEFDRQVNGAFQAADRAAQLSVPEVSRWIEVAQQIADVIGGPLLVSAGRARRRLELYNRRASDKRKLANYLPRKEQDAAIDDLLKDDEHWALHFAGEGGVGKTMLLRHLTERPGLAVSRVDFDYLNPDYPSRAPGLLLVALAEEFRLQAGPDMESAFERFDRRVKTLHSKIEGELRVGRSDPLSLEEGLFEDVLQAFVDALGKLVENRHPVLLLDTCEELAKIRPDGSIPDNVTVTFDVLNRLHTRYKRLRVIFAGRRPLASAGYGGWTAESPLAPQPHLRLHLIEHFTVQQANDYLAAFHEEVDGRTVDVPRDHIPVLCSLSKTSSGGARRRFSIPGQSSIDEERYNPYDLEMYADWVCRDPNLTPEKLAAAGRHYYIRERIVGRAGKVRPLVPIMAVCGRFDVAILRQFVTQSMGEPDASITLEQRIRAVTDLDWIQPDRAAGPDMWRVDNPLRERLLRYYESQETAVCHAARQTVAAVLKQETLSRPFPQLNEQYFETALDTLSDEPQEAAAWWGEIEGRIATEGQWVWASRLISLLLAHPVLAPDRPISPRAGVLATRAAALLHTGEADPASIWPDVTAALEHYPNVPQRRRIELRVKFATETLAEPPKIQHAGDDPQLLASCLARIEAMVEGGDRVSGLQECIGDLFSRVKGDPGLRAFVRSLGARLDVNRGELTRAVWKETLNVAPAGIASIWLDWLPPDDLRSRIALEFIRTGHASAEDIFEQMPVEPSWKTVDADRLASAMLLRFQRTLGAGAGDPEIALQKPRCKAHRYYPPYFVAVLWKNACEGAPGEALAQLGKLSSSFSSFTDVALVIDRASLDIRLRYRIAAADVPAAVKNSPAKSDRLLTSIYTHLFLDRNTRAEGVSSRIGEDRCYPVAELAMREAESDLTRQGPRSVSALNAAEVCRVTGDAVGEMLAVATEAVWAASAKDKERISFALAKLKTIYELNSRGGVPVLPTWFELEGAVRASKISDVLDRIRPEWQPTIVRIAAALHYQINGNAEAQDLLMWVMRNYSIKVLGGQRIPAELEFLKPVPASKIRKAFDKAMNASYFLFGFLIFIAFLISIYKGFVAGLHKIGLNLGTLENLGLFGATLGVLGILPRIVAGLLSLYFRMFEFRLVIKPAETPSNPNRPLDVPHTLRNSTKLFRLHLFEHEYRLKPTTEERYARLREQMMETKSRTTFQLLRRLLFGAKADIEIVAEESTVAAPWEALVHIASPGSALKDTLYRSRRMLPLRKARATQAPADGQLKAAVWSWATETQVASRRLIHLLRGGNKLEIAIPPSPDSTPADTDILVIYGDPAEGTATLGLELENFARPQYIQTSQAYKTESAVNITPSGLYTPASITSRCPNLRMCIVQLPPGSVSPRVSSDRRDAALMRRIGAELFKTGIPAVLMLPGAIEEAPAEVVDKIRPALRGSLGPRNTARTIVAAVNELQQALATLNLPDREAALEIALDVCLYIEDRVDLRVNTRKTRPVAD